VALANIHVLQTDRSLIICVWEKIKWDLLCGHALKDNFLNNVCFDKMMCNKFNKIITISPLSRGVGVCYDKNPIILLNLLSSNAYIN
jgi:hypothetical protein